MGRRRVIGGKEVRFFGKYDPETSFSDYLSFFPSMRDVKASRKHFAITGEASPSYMFYSGVAHQIQKFLPKIKLIALLRDPIDRLNSHYHHSLLSQNISSSGVFPKIGEFVDAELEIIDWCVQGDPSILVKNEPKLHRQFLQCHKNYTEVIGGTDSNLKRRLWDLQLITRGLYFVQLSSYLEKFPPDQILVLKSEDFFQNTSQIMQQVTDFLEIKAINWHRIVKKRHNFGERNKILESDPSEKRNPPLDFGLQQKLRAFYAIHNQKLREVVGFSWD